VKSSESTTFLLVRVAEDFDKDEDDEEDVDGCWRHFELLGFIYVPLTLCAALNRAELGVNPTVFDCLGFDLLA